MRIYCKYIRTTIPSYIHKSSARVFNKELIKRIDTQRAMNIYFSIHFFLVQACVYFFFKENPPQRHHPHLKKKLTQTAHLR